MSGPSVFSPRLLLALVAAAAGAFALSIYLLAFGGGTVRDAVGPSSFSRSAIGYAGYAELLRRLGLDVIKGRGEPGNAAGSDDLLVLAEPPPSAEAEERRMVLRAGRALVILPKWHGIADDKRPGWIGAAVLKGSGAADWVVSLTGAKGRTVRVAAPSAWPLNRLGITPEIGAQVQLLADSDLAPLVAAPEGLLVGEREVNGRKVRVLADPDILSNHGILREANARFAVALIRDLHDPDGRVIFDETVHGYRAPGLNPLRLPFEFPFSLVTGLGAAALALTLWTAMVRFGPARTLPPPLPAGKRALIRNAARLIGLAGRGEPVVASYVEATLREAGRRLRAPQRLDEVGLVAWLDRAGRARGVEIDLPALVERAGALRRGAPADAPALVRLAGDAYRWKRRILDGA